MSQTFPTQNEPVISIPAPQRQLWEEFLTVGLELRETKDNSQWKLGELVERVKDKFGGQAIKELAIGISVPYNSLREYWRVGLKIPPQDRILHLSYRHHQLAANTDNPKEWLEKAADNSWTVELMSLKINEIKIGKPIEPRPRVDVCDECGKWTIVGVEQDKICHCRDFKYKIRPVLEKPVLITKKYSSIKDITDADILEISDTYKVGPGFVKLRLEELRNYCEAKGKVYKNYKAALRNFVLSDMKRVVERRIPDAGKRGVDARQV